jgi:hypothetical protein
VTDTADEQRPGPLMREALDLFGEYQHTGGRPLITRAVPAFRTALAAADRYGVPDIAAYYNNLAYALHELAEATGDRAAQAESADWHRAAVAATERDDPDLAGYLCTLASGLCAQFGYTGQAEPAARGARGGHGSGRPARGRAGPGDPECRAGRGARQAVRA